MYIIPQKCLYNQDVYLQEAADCIGKQINLLSDVPDAILITVLSIRGYCGVLKTKIKKV